MSQLEGQIVTPGVSGMALQYDQPVVLPLQIRGQEDIALNLLTLEMLEFAGVSIYCRVGRQR
jgi:hypothetical protein